MIYLDHAATTPLDNRVFEAMLPYLKNTWGNPSSPHKKGREARTAIEDARRTIADLIGCKAHEVIFVSSASEANSLALFGTCDQWIHDHGTPGHVIALSIEHHCSLKAIDRLKEAGWDITLLPVDQYGQLNPDDLKKAIRKDTAIATIQWANNEVGTIQPIEEVATLCAESKIPLHIDAVQPMGQLPCPKIPEMMSMAAHKFYGPKGIGALVIREEHKLQPQILGGGQEFGMRAGTENTPAIVGMAKALEIAMDEQKAEQKRLTELRDFFVSELLQNKGISLNGHPTERLPNNINIRINHKSAESTVIQLDLEGICVATGSACVTGANEPSHVLQAMGQTGEQAKENIRLSLGRATTKEDLETVVSALQKILQS